MSAETKLSHRGRIIKEIIAQFNKNETLRNKFSAGGDNPIAQKPYKYSDSYRVDAIELSSCKAELLVNKDNASDYLIIQLHGGGYVGGLKNSYRTMACMYSEAGKGAAVLSVDYRLAPDNTFPAALEDAALAYSWALEHGYSEDKVIVAGDSAGGGLALSLCHLLKQKEMNMPKAVIVMSPWTDLTASGESYTKNKDIDPIFSSRPEDVIGSTYIGDDDPTNPLISPVFGDFDGFPPMLIQVGSEEMLLSDSEAVRDKAYAAGVKVEYKEYNGMFHVFQMAGKFIPEAKLAWEQIGEFIACL